MNLDNWRRAGRGWACPACGGGYPGDVPDERVCTCGQDGWGAPFLSADLTLAEWGHLTDLLKTRSGGCCEIRSPWCLAGRGGQLAGGVPFNRHHRKGRGSGGTDNPRIHSLANLMIACGSGTTGCHGYIGHEPNWARARGFTVDRPFNPAEVAVILHGGRLVYLDPVNPEYVNPPGGPRYVAA